MGKKCEYDETNWNERFAFTFAAYTFVYISYVSANISDMRCGTIYLSRSKSSLCWYLSFYGTLGPIRGEWRLKNRFGYNILPNSPWNLIVCNTFGQISRELSTGKMIWAQPLFYLCEIFQFSHLFDHLKVDWFFKTLCQLNFYWKYDDFGMLGLLSHELSTGKMIQCPHIYHWE